jgi:hypothetical protein
MPLLLTDQDAKVDFCAGWSILKSLSFVDFLQMSIAPQAMCKTRQVG